MAPTATATATDNSSCCSNLKENLTLFATHDSKLELLKTPTPKPGPGEALVHVKATGVCGSDVHFWQHAGLGPWKITDKTALGHESGGIVIAVGENVHNVKPGDRVAIEPGVPCGKATCNNCLTGQYNLCPQVDFFSVPPKNGTLTRHHIHPAGWLHKCPDSLSYEEIACLEPLSVCLHATQQADIRLGTPTLICGAGPIGIVQLLCASAAGASPIVLTDMLQNRLDFAKTLVPDVVTYQVDPKKTPEVAAKDIISLFTEACSGVGGSGPNGEVYPSISMECTGVESSIGTACYATKTGGLVFVIGVGKSHLNFPFMHCSTNEIAIKFLFRYKDTWPRAIRLVASGKIDIKKIVTARFPLEEAKAAVEHAADRTKFSVKTIILDE